MDFGVTDTTVICKDELQQGGQHRVITLVNSASNNQAFVFILTLHQWTKTVPVDSMLSDEKLGIKLQYLYFWESGVS